MTTFSQTCSITTVSLGTLAGLTSQAQPSVAGGNVKVIVLPFGHTSQKLNSFKQSETTILSGITSNHYSVAGGNIANILTYTATPFHSGITKMISLVSALLPSLSGSSTNLYPNIPGGNLGQILRTTETNIGLTKLINLMSSNLLPALALGTKLFNAITYLCSGNYLYADAAKSAVLHPVTPSMSNAFLITLARKIAWRRTPLIGQVLSLTYNIFKTIKYTQQQLLALQKLIPKSTFVLLSSELLKFIKQTAKLSVANVGESVLLSYNVFKIIKYFHQQLLKLQNNSFKIINLASGELLTLTKRTAKSFVLAIGEILHYTALSGTVNFKTLSTATANILNYATTSGTVNFKTLSLAVSNILNFATPAIFKTIFITTSNIFSRSTAAVFKTIYATTSNILNFSATYVFKILFITTANVLTEVGQSFKNILVFSGELISLTKYVTKTIFMYLAELLTTNQGKKIYVVNPLLYLRQLLTEKGVKTQVARRPIKIIPLNFEYQLPFSYTQAPTNPIYVNDAATVFMTPSEPVSASQAIAMRITAPNGTAVTRYYPLVWISQIPSWSEAGDAQNLTTFAVTQFDPGELNQVGYWSIALIYNGISAQNGTFYVGPAP